MKNFYIDKIWVSPERPLNGYMLWIDPEAGEIKVCLDDDKHFSHHEEDCEWLTLSTSGGGMKESAV